MTGTAGTVVRWVARLLSVASIALLGLFAFGGQEEMVFANAREMAGFILFPVGVVTGFIVAWKWELLGALISILSLAGFYVWHFASSGSFAAGPWFAIFTSPALLFLIASFLTASTTESPE